jgi:hypothetical protein
MTGASGVVLSLFVGACALVAPVQAIAAEGEPDSLTVTAGAHYGRSSIHRFFFGSDYRKLWTTPIRVPVLDMSREAGGLRPVRRVGGRQTQALALAGADGRSYTFRGVVKDVSGLIDEQLKGTIVESILKDQMAAQHPASELVAGSLTRAAGLRTQAWRLVALPDDPALGEFRDEFKGAVGFFGEFPTASTAEHPGTFGLTEVVGHKELYHMLETSPSTRIDVDEFLTARLLDLAIGDWDRHRRQWRWGRVEGDPLWHPIPEDRDQAFSRYEGFFLGVGRTRDQRFQSYDDKYESVSGLMWNGRDQDRQLLSGITREEVMSAARALQAKLTDEEIERAVATMPEAWRVIDGPKLTADLKGRRDRLPDAAKRFYEQLAHKVDVTLTSEPERVEAVRQSNGDLDLTVHPATSAPQAPDPPAGEPSFHRAFHRGETSEVRLYMLDGDDHVTVTGPDGGIRLRVVGGPGDDRLDARGSGPAKLSDFEGHNETDGAPWDDHVYVPPPAPATAPWIRARDWGSKTYRTPVISYGPDLGFFVGLSIDHRSYAFRKHPYGTRNAIRGGWAFGSKSGKAEYLGEFRRENRRDFWGFRAYASGVDVLRFYGLGNGTANLEGDRSRVRAIQFLAYPSYNTGFGRHSIFQIGPVFKQNKVRQDKAREDSSFVFLTQPYGYGNFATLGAHTEAVFDSRDNPAFPRKGLVIAARGTVYPKALDADETFGEANGNVSTYLSTGARFTIALRGGGKKLWGQYPFYESAKIGGGSVGEGTFGEPDYTLRPFAAARFQGDASLWGNAEARLRLFSTTLLLPSHIGLLAFADGGRVWYGGEDSDIWHGGGGGGGWLSFLGDRGTFSAGYATSGEDNRFYFKGGFTY